MNDNSPARLADHTDSSPSSSITSGISSGSSPSLPHHKLIAYTVALELLTAVRAAQVRDPKLRDESLRSAKSACLNTAEGAGRVSRPDKARSFAIARAEAGEAAAAVEIAASCGDASPAASARVALVLVDSVPVVPVALLALVDPALVLDLVLTVLPQVVAAVAVAPAVVPLVRLVRVAPRARHVSQKPRKGLNSSYVKRLRSVALVFPAVTARRSSVCVVDRRWQTSLRRSAPHPQAW